MVNGRVEKRAACRVGILYRRSRCITSICIPVCGGMTEENDIGKQLDRWWSTPESPQELIDIVEWISTHTVELDRDDSYLGYFYRCLQEGSTYYYLYEAGIGWSCGDVTGKSPISSKLVRLSDAIPQMEEWEISLKYQEATHQ